MLKNFDRGAMSRSNQQRRARTVGGTRLEIKSRHLWPVAELRRPSTTVSDQW